MADASGSMAALLSSIGDVTKLAADTASQITAQTAVVNDKAKQIEIDRAANLQSQQDVQDLATRNSATIMAAMNLTPGEANNAVAKLLTERQQLDDEQKQLYDQVRQKQSVQFGDDPLGWIVNHYTVGPLIDQHNAVVDRRNTVTGNIEALSIVADSAEKASWAGIAVTNAVVIDARQKQLAFDSLQKSMAATKEVASFNIDSLSKNLQATGKIAELQSMAFQARNSQIMVGLAQQRDAREVTLFNEQQEDYKDWKSMADTVSTRFFNGADISVPMMKRMYTEPGIEGYAARALGKAALTKGSIGNSPGEAVVVAGLQNLNFKNGDQAYTQQQLQAMVPDAMKKANVMDLMSWKKLAPEEKAMALNAVIKDKIIGPISRGTYIVTPDSPYAAPSVGNMLAKFSDLTNMPIWESMKGLPPETKLDYNQLRSVGIEAVKTGKYGEVGAQAMERMVTDINQTFQAVNNYTAAQRGFSTIFGLPLLTNRYNINTGASMFDPRSNTLNAISKADVMRDVLRELVLPTAVNITSLTSASMD